MTYEEMQRMMEFILDQQAQLTAKQQRAEERINKADKRLDRADKLIDRIIRTIDKLATTTVKRVSSLSEGFDVKLAALTDAQMRTEDAVRRLTERGEKTDEAVKNLTEAVARHLRDHRNDERDVSRE